MRRFGLGPGIVGRLEILPYAALFRIAARFHDIAYGRGGNEADRARADAMFFRLMAAQCRSEWELGWAKLYYSLVRNF